MNTQLRFLAARILQLSLLFPAPIATHTKWFSVHWIPSRQLHGNDSLTSVSLATGTSAHQLSSPSYSTVWLGTADQNAYIQIPKNTGDLSTCCSAGQRLQELHWGVNHHSRLFRLSHAHPLVHEDALIIWRNEHLNTGKTAVALNK